MGKGKKIFYLTKVSSFKRSFHMGGQQERTVKKISYMLNWGKWFNGNCWEVLGLQVVRREEDSGKVNGCPVSAVGWSPNISWLSLTGGDGGRAGEQNNGAGIYGSDETDGEQCSGWPEGNPVEGLVVCWRALSLGETKVELGEEPKETGLPRVRLHEGEEGSRSG